ncbi:MAG: hypothetical protein AAF202_09765, partial [Pseudomonadota bacterium]
MGAKKLGGFFHPEDVFELNSNLKPKVLKVGNEKSRIMIVDGFYAHPQKVRKLFLQTPAPIWKDTNNTRNFKDYYDCRQTFEFEYGYDQVPEAIEDLVADQFGFRVRYPNIAATNVFQLIKPQPQGTSAYPHVDVTDVPKHEQAQPVNALIYLNTKS